MSHDDEEMNPTAKLPDGNATPANKLGAQESEPQFGVAIFLVVVAAVVALIVGLPPVRDALIPRLPGDVTTFVSEHRDDVRAWIEWLKTLFEGLLALLISNQVFNEAIKSWFQKRMRVLQAGAVAKIERSISEDKDEYLKDTRKFILELSMLTLPSATVADAIRDGRHLIRQTRAYSRNLEVRLVWIGIRMAFLGILNAFAGQLHALSASVMFLCVLTMKVAKLYADAM